MKEKAGEKKITNEKPLSLHPHRVEEVLKKFLQTPPPEKVKKKTKKQKK